MEFTEKQTAAIHHFLEEYIHQIELEGYNEAYKW